MSYKSDLDSLERDWERHLDWRRGRRHFGQEDPPGEYRVTGRNFGSDLELRLVDLPRAVRDQFLANIERLIADELDQVYAREHARLALEAIDEAKRTLETLAKLAPTEGEKAL